MAEKSFGIKELNIIGSSGTPQIQSVENLKVRVGVGSTVIIGDSDSDFTSPAQVDSNNTTVLNVGIVTANYFYGDGTNLTGVARTDNINADSLYVSGISTLGITSATSLYVSGISTFAGITTVTGDTLFTKQLSVSGLSTYIGVATYKSNVFIDGTLTAGAIDGGTY